MARGGVWPSAAPANKNAKTRATDREGTIRMVLLLLRWRRDEDEILRPIAASGLEAERAEHEARDHADADEEDDGDDDNDGGVAAGALGRGLHQDRQPQV